MKKIILVSLLAASVAATAFAGSGEKSLKRQLQEVAVTTSNGVTTCSNERREWDCDNAASSITFTSQSFTVKTTNGDTTCTAARTGENKGTWSCDNSATQVVVTGAKGTATCVLTASTAAPAGGKWDCTTAAASV